MAAVLRASFYLEDHASKTLSDIAAKAELLDKKLKALDSRNTQLRENQISGLREMKASMRESTLGVHDNINSVRQNLKSLTAKPWQVKMRIDDRELAASLNRANGAIDRAMTNNARRSGRRGGGPLAGILGALGLGGATGAGGSKIGRNLMKAVQGNLAQFGNLGRSIGVSLGPISARLNALVPLLVVLGPLVAAVGSALVTVLATGLAAVGTAALGAVVGLGAFMMGIGAIAVPIGIATKKIAEHYDKIDKAAEKLNKYAFGTKAYNRALKEQQRAFAGMSKEERAVYGGVLQVQGAWNRWVTMGPSGKRALEMMTDALKIAEQLIPSVAKQMDRFTLVGVGMFRDMQRNIPGFQKRFEQMTEPMPRYFSQISRGFGHIVNGLMGVVIAARPITTWLINQFHKLTVNFDRWANSGKGQRQMRGFFNDMKPVLQGVFTLLGAVGGAFLEIAQQGGGKKGFAVDVLDSLTKAVRGLPDFVEGMTEAFRRAWPTIVAGVKSVLLIWRDMIYLAEKTIGVIRKISPHLDPLTRSFNNAGIEGRHLFEGVLIFWILRSIPIVGLLIRALEWGLGRALRFGVVAAARVGMAALGPVLMGAMGPAGWIILGVIAGVTLLYTAWQNNWFGIQGIVKDSVDYIAKELNKLDKLMKKTLDPHDKKMPKDPKLRGQIQKERDFYFKEGERRRRERKENSIDAWGWLKSHVSYTTPAAARAMPATATAPSQGFYQGVAQGQRMTPYNPGFVTPKGWAPTTRSGATQLGDPGIVARPGGGNAGGSGMQAVSFNPNNAAGGQVYPAAVKGTQGGGPRDHGGRSGGGGSRPGWQSDNAIDIMMPMKTPLYALADGVISGVGYQGGTNTKGWKFTLSNGDNSWWYGHLSGVEVKNGQRVKAGQLIGYSGTAGNGSDPHLHLGQRVGNPETIYGLWGAGRQGAGRQGKPRPGGSGPAIRPGDRLAASLGSRQQPAAGARRSAQLPTVAVNTTSLPGTTAGGTASVQGNATPTVRVDMRGSQITINNGDDYELFANRLADEIEAVLANLPMADAKDMAL